MKNFMLNTGLFKTAALIVLLVCITVAGKAQTTITTGVTTNASTITAGNTVTINAGGTLNMDVSRNFASITASGSGTSAITGAGTATVTGAVSISPGNNNTNTLTIASTTTVSCTSITLGTGNTNSRYNITLSGVLKNSGTTAALSALNCNATSRVEYTGAAQTIFLTSYQDLTLSGTGGKTFPTGATTINGILSIENATNANIFTGTITYGSSATLQYNTTSSRAVSTEWPSPFLATGGVILAGSGTITLDNNKILGNNTSVPLTINAGTLNTSLANNYSLTFNGNYINNGGTLTANASSITITGTVTSQSIAGFTTTGSVSLTKNSGTATLTGAVTAANLVVNSGSPSTGILNLGTSLTHSFSGAWTMSAGELNGGSSTLKVAGTLSSTSGTFTCGTGTVELNGTGAQSIPSFTYYNLTITATSNRTVTLGTDVQIKGDFTPASTSTTYTTTGSTVTFNGSGNQNINNTFAFNSLTITSSASVIMNANLSTGSSGTLTLTSGNLSINGNTLTINGTSVTATSGQIDATGAVNSVMQVTTSGTLSMPFQAVNGGMNRVTVSGGGTLQLVPALPSNVFDIQDILTLTNSSKLELSTDANLQITGTVSMGTGGSPTGYIKGNTQARMRLSGGTNGAIGTLYFDPSTDRSTNSINEMVIAPSGSGRSVILGNKLNIISLLTPLSNSNTFTFTSNGYLTLRSSSKWTACVNTVGTGTTFSGDVVVERYVRAKSVRRYVFLGAPVNGSTIRQSWQDSIFITAPGTGGAVCGSTSGNGGGTDKYNSKGYDVTTANLYTIQTYEPSGTSGAFVNFGYKADSMPLIAGKGYKVLYRGPRYKNTDGSSNCTALLNTGGTGISADTVTVTAKGTMNYGTISVTLNGKPSGANYGYTLLSNPYPAQLDFDKFYLGNTSSGMNRGFWIHDPNGSNTTGYVTTKYVSGSYHTVGRDPSSASWTTDSSAIGYISSGQGFFVSTANTSNLGASFLETHKVIPTIQQGGAFRSTAAAATGIRTFFFKSDSTYIDDVLVMFSDDTLINNNTYDDRFDASSLNSTNYMTSIKGGRSCAIQTRRDDYYNDTVAIRIVSAATGDFYLNFTEFQSMSAGGIYLLDLYLGTTTDIQLNPFYSFSITSDAASQGANRFKIVFRSLTSVLPLSFINIAATQKQQGAEVAWKVGFEQNVVKYAVERSEDGRNFYTVGMVNSKGNSSIAVDYAYLDKKTINNVVYYRVKSIEASGDTKKSAIVRLNSSKESLITLYPNPVKDQLKIVVANSQNFDKARTLITNAVGRTVLEQNLSGSNGNYTIDVSALSVGMYILTIINQNGDRINEKFIKN
jgi:hypothetical protein